MWRALAAVGVVTALVGCANERRFGPEDNPSALRDVTGVQFGWTCDGRGCQVTQQVDTPPPDRCPEPKDSAYSFAWGRFVEICSVCLFHTEGAYWGTTAGQCRLVACETDANCPALYQSAPEDGYACVNGLCQNADTVRFPRDRVVRDEVEQLCFAVVPRPATVSPFADETKQVLDTVEAVCPAATYAEPCSVPAGCRMP